MNARISNIRNNVETITYARVRLGDTLGDNLLVAFLVTGIPTILALVSHSIDQEGIAERAQDELVELTLNELVSIHFVNFFFPLANRALTAETTWGIQRTLANILLDY